MNELYLLALTTGIIGSIHCIGMCGPIAVALPLGKKSWPARILGSLTYNSGRVITYGILGGLFGLFGQGIELAGLQQWASIGIGIAMLVSVIFPVLFREKITIDKILTGYASRLITNFRRYFSKSSISSLFIIGILNGLLPCGLVYIAIAGALSSGNIQNGILYMVLFGIGTIPVMFIIPVAGHLIGRGLRKKFRGVVTTFIVVLGIIFILRGLSLGIPYLSPPVKALQPHQKMMQHEKNVNLQDTLPSCH